MSALQYIGNGDGYIYITSNVAVPTDTDIITNVPNTCDGIEDVVYPKALSSAALYANKSANSTITVSAVAGVGNVTGVTINAVNQISGNISVSGLSTSQVADAIADAINTFTPSGPDYKAVSIGSTVSVNAPQDQGSDVNGLTVSVSNDDPGNITITATDLEGGANSNELIDEGCGYKFFINPNFDSNGCAGQGTAIEGDLTNAVEISDDIIFQGLQGSIKEQIVVASSGQIVPVRDSAIQVVLIESEVGFSDDIETISTEDFSDNDIIYTRAKPDHLITYKSSGNITLEGGNDFQASESDNLVLIKDANGWLEVSRSEARLGDTSDYRNAGFPFPIEGVTSIVIPSSGAFSIEANTFTVSQILTGTVVLTGSLSYSFGVGAGVNAGDEFWLFMDGSVRLNGNTFTINGENISEFEAEKGGWLWRGKFNGSSWDGAIMPNLGDNSTWKLDVANRIEAQGITLDKIESSINTEIITIPVSFEAGELVESKFVIPYDCTVTSITSYVNKAIEATDDATIVPKDDASLVMTGGTTTLTAGTGAGTGVTQAPTANNTFTAGQVMTLETLKTTVGGKALVSITLVRS